eukprot:scaffold169643_cov73-Cyclotella_meneghiniana.AAC.5
MAISHDHHGNVSLMSDACGLSVVIINKVSIIMARVEDMQMILNAIVHNDLWVRSDGKRRRVCFVLVVPLCYGLTLGSWIMPCRRWTHPALTVPYRT